MQTTFKQAEAIIAFGRSLGAARSGKPAAAKEELAHIARLHQEIAAAGDPYWAEQVGIQETAARAWIALSEKDTGRAIASMKITPSDIDVAAATARRIPVTVISPIVTEATADIHFALLLAVARRVVEGDRLVRAGVFPGAQSAHLLGAGVYGKTIGLIGGGGRIGRAVAQRAHGFSMRTLYWTPRRKPEHEEQQVGLIYVPYDELLSESDFVSVHAPLNAETRHLVGERELRLMKPTAFLINTARGPVVDEKALVRALAERRIAGAGLDVFENEPQVEPELVGMRNVVLTPHLGSAVKELREEMANVVVDNILAVLEGRHPPNCWNFEIYQ